ncbi:uncharacterized protein LOC142176620 isoform X2 [Nicotiana tabacum]|uniref:Uncharacterized protein LOC142176620 isoform X2 n=1 Tax=Nicotiana tabacum TaxID=4097 RepID=A0AC58TU77_TOBAC
MAVHIFFPGPVHYRWMYPIERYLGTLKSYVRNCACPEGSIAEAYIANECMTFCSRYLEGGVQDLIVQENGVMKLSMRQIKKNLFFLLLESRTVE